MKNNTVLAVFFDLDGTLLDTAPDLYQAMLKTLKQMGREPIRFEHFRPHVHTGTTGMLKGSLGMQETDPAFEEIRDIFLVNYQKILHQETDYFPGMLDVLNALDQQKLPWGVITNKPRFLTEPLLASFRLDQRSRCIISGDTLPRRKPHPDPLLHACQLVGIAPSEAVYVGDTEIDVEAAKAAGMQSIAVLYGYHEQNSRPETWGADHLVAAAPEILEKIGSF